MGGVETVVALHTVDVAMGATPTRVCTYHCREKSRTTCSVYDPSDPPSHNHLSELLRIKTELDRLVLEIERMSEQLSAPLTHRIIASPDGPVLQSLVFERVSVATIDPEFGVL